MRWIAKPDTWFDAGTEAELLVVVVENAQACDGVGCGLFSGVRGGKPDDEMCSFGEFDVQA